MSRLAPVMNLSVELLSYIFELADVAHRMEVEEEFPSRDYSTKRKHILPVHLSHVSQYFRDVALATSSLWSIIYVTNLHDSQIEYIETCIKRSGKVCPLYVHLVFSWRTRTFRHDDVVIRTMTLIQANTYRLKEFGAVFIFVETAFLAMKFLDHSAPLLTRLILHYIGNHPSNDSTSGSVEHHPGPFIPFMGEMNQLKELDIDHIGIGWPFCTFQNLDILVLGHFPRLNLTSSVFWNIIQNSPSLRKLDISNDSTVMSALGQDRDGHNPASAPTIILNSLQELCLFSITTDDALELISRIHAPQMRSLMLGRLLGGGFSQFLERLLGPPLLFPDLDFIELSGSSTYRAFARLSSAYPLLTSEWKTIDQQDILTFYSQDRISRTSHEEERS